MKIRNSLKSAKLRDKNGKAISPAQARARRNFAKMAKARAKKARAKKRK